MHQRQPRSAVSRGLQHGARTDGDCDCAVTVLYRNCVLCLCLQHAARCSVLIGVLYSQLGCVQISGHGTSPRPPGAPCGPAHCCPHVAPHTRHISRRLALSSAPTAAGLKPFARRPALFPVPIEIHLSVLCPNLGLLGIPPVVQDRGRERQGQAARPGRRGRGLHRGRQDGGAARAPGAGRTDHGPGGAGQPSRLGVRVDGYVASHHCITAASHAIFFVLREILTAVLNLLKEILTSGCW